MRVDWMGYWSGCLAAGTGGSDKAKADMPDKIMQTCPVDFCSCGGIIRDHWCAKCGKSDSEKNNSRIQAALERIKKNG